jgi:hypothetical protein
MGGRWLVRRGFMAVGEGRCREAHFNNSLISSDHFVFVLNHSLKNDDATTLTSAVSSFIGATRNEMKLDVFRIPGIAI